MSGHPSIIRYVFHKAVLPKQPITRNHVEYFLVTEFCSGGPLIELMKREALTCEQICKIFNSVVNAAHHMHDRSPPITHRDLKVKLTLLTSYSSLEFSLKLTEFR